ncbi:MAG TPA: hypothetical protein VG938_00160 [Verrucomicrobiae bacterium]|nr:hypothetical protein [Verrucomicrobiae bacterium]
MRHLLAIVLSVGLALFLLDAVISFVDDFLILFFHSHAISFPRGLISMIMVLVALGIYALMGLTPMVPKRLFLPVAGFYIVAMLVTFPMAIYGYERLQVFAFIVSGCQLVIAGALIFYASRGSKFSWRVVPVERLGARAFSWRNLAVFALANAVLLMLTGVYLFVCTARAVGHFSEGFMALHPSGFTVQVRKYVRDDGKVIELFPMAHIANADFYQQVSRTFPSNSTVLMEGVSDSQNLLTNKITYKRMAKSLGLAEQKETFVPATGDVVRADVDVDQFSGTTIDFLNLVMLIHSRGMNAENLSKLLEFTPPPDFERQLFDDILIKRNEHLVGEIQAHLPQSDSIMVPWGVAHMPGIAREIQKAGFHLSETHEYSVIRFRTKKGVESAK